MSVQDIFVEGQEMLTVLGKLKAEGARFITITVLDRRDRLEVIYHFEKGTGLVNLRVTTGKDSVIPSITPIYGAAFLAENEAQDLFKLKISGMNVDFSGKMLKVEGAIGDTLMKPALSGSVPMVRHCGRCMEKCPATVNVPKYLRQIAMGDPSGAYETVVEQAPLPAILGRVCFAPCERGCRQEKNARSSQIRLLKRYAADMKATFKRDVRRAEPTGKRVAIVGGGPSGITAAYYLGMLGHSVTLYEKRTKCGGAMLSCIPKYRLPRSILQSEICARFGEAGVKVRAGSQVKSLDELFRDGNDAIFVGIGAEKSLKLMIDGEDSPGVIDCLDLLSKANIDVELPKIGNKVIIIGGGNGAIDAARTAKRLGARSVIVCYRRTWEDMPASPSQVQAAVDEGIYVKFMIAPVRIVEGKPLKIVFQSMKLGDIDPTTGRCRFIPESNSEFELEADTVIKAIGQSVEVPKEFGLAVDRGGRIVVRDGTYETSLKGVWAGGDAVFGPTSVVEAIRDGRKAASLIDKYLGGKGLPEPELDPGEFVSKPLLHEGTKVKAKSDPIPARIITTDDEWEVFEEVEVGLCSEEAIAEASRCWRCDWNE